ncbi:hypothetical protein ACRALDRAFT_2044681 [Sodiomyces alcalophilus JCM 7366]|uniref:uncharacterized protein n=1 Tax=Sodiomyces alcalophilus JCM 7366 TaxID=591952 RepID=UPI0039B37529
MLRATGLLTLLVGLAAAQDVHLRNFADLDESGISLQCRRAYNVPLEGCRARDFFPGSACSTPCLFGITKLQADIQQTCGGVLVPINTLLGQALLGNLPAVLCPNNDLDDPVGTTATATTTTMATMTSETPTSTSTTESPSTISTTPTPTSTRISTTTSTTLTTLESTSSSPVSSSSSESSIAPPSSRTSTRTSTPSPTPTETPPEPEDDDEQEEEQEQRRPDPGGDLLNLFPEQAAAGTAQKPYMAGAVIASLFSIGAGVFFGL